MGASAWAAELAAEQPVLLCPLQGTPTHERAWLGCLPLPATPLSYLRFAPVAPALALQHWPFFQSVIDLIEMVGGRVKGLWVKGLGCCSKGLPTTAYCCDCKTGIAQGAAPRAPA